MPCLHTKEGLSTGRADTRGERNSAGWDTWSWLAVEASTSTESKGPAGRRLAQGTEQAEGSCSRDDVTNKVFAITDRAETSNVIIYAVLALLPLA